MSALSNHGNVPVLPERSVSRDEAPSSFGKLSTNQNRSRFMMLVLAVALFVSCGIKAPPKPPLPDGVTDPSPWDAGCCQDKK